MKYLIKTCLIFVVILFIPISAFAEHHPKPRLISVTGDAEVLVVPDEVVFTLGVETIDNKLVISKTENSERVSKIISVAKKNGIEKKHIQTDYLSIEPRYENSKYSSAGNYEIDGYIVRNTIMVTLKDISKFEEFLSAVLEAGANYVHGVDFRTTELRKHRDEARSLAIKAAQEKANALAAELGQTVGQPYSIQENRTWWWSGYNSRWGGRWSGTMSQNVVQNTPGSDDNNSDSGVSLGQIKVSANVSVSFELN